MNNMTGNWRFLLDPMKIDFEKAEFARLNHLRYHVSSVREACSRPIGFQNVIAEPATSRTPENLLETQMTGAQQCVVAGPRTPSDVQSGGSTSVRTRWRGGLDRSTGRLFRTGCPMHTLYSLQTSGMKMSSSAQWGSLHIRECWYNTVPYCFTIDNLIRGKHDVS